jgi:Na+/H+ antiporter NhaC
MFKPRRIHHFAPIQFLACIIVSLTVHASVNAEEVQGLQMKFPPLLVAGIPAEVQLLSLSDSALVPVVHAGDTFWVAIRGGRAEIQLIPVAHEPLSLKSVDQQFISDNRALPLWFSVIPPLIAILIALLFREVFSALVLGLLSGTFMMAWYSGTGFLAAVPAGLFRIIDTYVVHAIADKDHVSIIVFSFMIGGMVHIITRNGGMKGVVKSISAFASTRRSTLFSTWLLGLIVFFDDYANTLVVGNTMRPVADRMHISREKLSYVVDSTAAPVTAIAFITTWIGAELSYIKNAVDAINEVAPAAISESPYSIFFQSLAYSFYPILTLFFVLMIILSKRDFGPMRVAEERASKGLHEERQVLQSDKEYEPDASVTPRAFNALIPVLVVVFGTCAGLLFTGLEQVSWSSSLSAGANLSNVIGHADSFRALLWASFGGVLTALMLSVTQRILSLQKSVESMINGFKTMLTAMLILVLAWSLATLTQHLHTAEFLSSVMLRLHIAPQWLPVITFLLAAMVSFSTGSSWGTMAILYPLLLPTAWSLFIEFQIPQQEAMMLFHCIIASVLAGSVFGDHCSPISDTTILSSLATGCNHVDHVRTQLPYALTVGGVTIFVGLLPVSFGLHPAIAMLLAMPVMWLVIRLAGKTPADS